jgi:hypothetical protein
MFNKLRHLLGPSDNHAPTNHRTRGASPSNDGIGMARAPRLDSNQEQAGLDGPPKKLAAHVRCQEDAHEYLNRVKVKISKLAEEFASGSINREQFHELYEHYQEEVRKIETWIDLAPYSDAWQEARKEGKSILIRQQHMARVLGYAIYQNESGIPINTIGEFTLDASLIIPMLSSYRSAAQEIFGAGMRSSQIENGQWLCFVPGETTTLIALFSTEPASKQLNSIREIHKVFELANCHILDQQVVDPNLLVFPHRSSVGRRQ